MRSMLPANCQEKALPVRFAWLSSSVASREGTPRPDIVFPRRKRAMTATMKTMNTAAPDRGAMKEDDESDLIPAVDQKKKCYIVCPRHLTWWRHMKHSSDNSSKLNGEILQVEVGSCDTQQSWIEDVNS